MTAFQTVDKEAKARRVIIVIELYRMAKVTLAKTKSKNSVYRKVALTLCSSHFWRFLSFARGQYPRTAPTRKIQNLSHFLKVYLRVEIYNLTFSTRRKAVKRLPLIPLSATSCTHLPFAREVIILFYLLAGGQIFEVPSY